MFARRLFSTAAPSVKTGIVMLNMGGPATQEAVGPFLQRLFADRDIMQLPLQFISAPLLAKRRTPRVAADYAKIGGSPIRKWTEIQGQEMCKILDKIRPESAPHKAYIAFRYADPLTEECLTQMKEDGVTRAVAFSQYPQYSCTTTGSSLNHLWHVLKESKQEDAFKWSVIDRWHSHDGYLDAVLKTIQEGLNKYDEAIRDKVTIVFSAHSLPIKIVARGDQYPPEIAAAAHSIIQRLRTATSKNNPYILAWQSQVGPIPWLGPQTGAVLEGLGKQGYKNVMVVPLGFTSDHIETLYEIDHTYAEVAQKAGITNFSRAPSLNDSPTLINAMADIVKTHLDQQQVCSSQYPINCPTCVNPMCRSILNPISSYASNRNSFKAVA